MALEHFSLLQTVAPAVEPLTVGDGSATDLKLWLRIDPGDTSQDALLPAVIAAARQRCERVTGRALVTQTWQLGLDRFPSSAALWDPTAAAGDYARLGPISDPRAVKLPRPPLQSVTSVTYVDLTGTVRTLTAGTGATGDYQVDANSEPGRVLPAYSTFWPVALPVTQACKVVYVAGYGDGAASVPAEIRAALMAHCAYTWREREAPDEALLDSLFEPFAHWGFR